MASREILKISKISWLSVVGPHKFENINSFWAFCEQRKAQPEGCHLLYPHGLHDTAQETKAWINNIFPQYFPHQNPLEFSLKEFNENDLPSFVKALEEVFQSEKTKKGKMAIDTTPGTWSYIPATLSLLAREERKMVVHLFYHQYSLAEHQTHPYPLIPRKALVLHDLLEDTHLGEYIYE